MKKEMLIKKLRDHVRQSGFIEVSKSIGISYGTLWNICLSGDVKKTATLDKIESYYKS
jgi:hypothetical protein